jgi:hypothetical protein
MNHTIKEKLSQKLRPFKNGKAPARAAPAGRLALARRAKFIPTSLLLFTCFAASFVEYLYISTERSVVGCFNEL